MKPKIRLPFVGKYPITFKFGAQPRWYVMVAGYPHNGVDFGTPVGTPILACANGTIIYADNVPDSDGLGIIISHKWGISLYWHLSSLTAKLGQDVKKGDSIGFSGSTGWATGPHLHFGTKVRGVEAPGMKGWSNPINYIIEPPVQPVPEPSPVREYRVRFGDSLWSIATKFYGAGYHWTRIYKANLDRIKHPSLIFPFQKLRIP